MALVGLLYTTIGATAAVGVMLWEPWADDGLDAARCEAALRSFQEAKSLYDDVPSDLVKDLATLAGKQWARECHLDFP